MNTISGKKFCQMMVAGANKLEINKKLVDEMNVFPVPDGDTGTNMSLTVTSAMKELLSVTSENASDLAKALSSGALRGARGNSGVIVSQLFRGFYKGVKGNEQINAVSLASGMQKGVETAYKAVMKPKEGTILTVAKGAAAAALEAALQTDDLIEVLETAVKEGKETLAKTPDMLPVLKEAGVVDSGGQGLVMIYEGMLEALKREDDEIDPLLALDKNLREQMVAKAQDCYCVELTVEAQDPEKAVLELEGFGKTLGENVMVLKEGQNVLLHIHTAKAGDILTKALCFGNLSQIKVENMRLSHNHVLDLQSKTQKKTEPRKEVGFITISVGEGLTKIFKQLGVDVVISGGQTMNPSTDDILTAADEVNADHIFVLPNNKNIILAAQQAEKLVKDKKIHVIPTVSIPQGISAMISFMGGEPIEDNIQSMSEGMNAVVSGQVTYAIRDTHMGEFEIKANDILALKNGEIDRVGQDLMRTSEALLDDMITDETGIVTIYYGEEANEEEAEVLKGYLADKYPDIEVEVNEGGQPIYYFLLSAE